MFSRNEQPSHHLSPHPLHPQLMPVTEPRPCQSPPGVLCCGHGCPSVSYKGESNISLRCWAPIYYSTCVRVNNTVSTHSTQPATWTLQRL